MRSRGVLLCALTLLFACDNDPAKEPSSFSKGSHRAAKDAAQDVVNECESRGFEVEVKRGGPACRGWINYEVHCKDDAVTAFAKLVCDEQDDFCSRPSQVCAEPDE